MSFIQAFFLGLLQGITEFLPVSSFGHTGILRKYFGIAGDFSTLFSVFLHIGTLFALLWVMRKEVRILIKETIFLTIDLIANASIWYHNRRNEKKIPYVKVIKSKSRQFTVMVLVATIPTFILGYTGSHLVFIWSLSAVWPAIGFLMTGIVLLVVHVSKAGGNKGIADTSIDQAMWIGIAQGLSIFPGISRTGLTISTGLFFGYSRKFALRYSYMLSVPAVLGSFIYNLSEFSSPAMSSDVVFSCLISMVVSAVTGILCIRIMMKLMRKIPFIFFAFYSFIIGVLTLVYNFQ